MTPREEITNAVAENLRHQRSEVEIRENLRPILERLRNDGTDEDGEAEPYLDGLLGGIALCEK